MVRSLLVVGGLVALLIALVPRVNTVSPAAGRRRGGVGRGRQGERAGRSRGRGAARGLEGHQRARRPHHRRADDLARGLPDADRATTSPSSRRRTPRRGGSRRRPTGPPDRHARRGWPHLAKYVRDTKVQNSLVDEPAWRPASSPPSSRARRASRRWRQFVEHPPAGQPSLGRRRTRCRSVVAGADRAPRRGRARWRSARPAPRRAATGPCSPRAPAWPFSSRATMSTSSSRACS